MRKFLQEPAGKSPLAEQKFQREILRPCKAWRKVRVAPVLWASCCSLPVTSRCASSLAHANVSSSLWPLFTDGERVQCFRATAWKRELSLRARSIGITGRFIGVSGRHWSSFDVCSRQLNKKSYLDEFSIVKRKEKSKRKKMVRAVSRARSIFFNQTFQTRQETPSIDTIDPRGKNFVAFLLSGFLRGLFEGRTYRGFFPWTYTSRFNVVSICLFYALGFYSFGASNFKDGCIHLSSTNFYLGRFFIATNGCYQREARQNIWQLLRIYFIFHFEAREIQDGAFPRGIWLPEIVRDLRC